VSGENKGTHQVSSEESRFDFAGDASNCALLNICELIWDNLLNTLRGLRNTITFLFMISCRLNRTSRSPVKQLLAEAKRTIFSMAHSHDKDHTADEDDDVFYADDNGAVQFPASGSTEDKPQAENTSADRKSAPSCGSRTVSGERITSTTQTIRRLFRFSVKAANVTRSISSSTGGAIPVSENRLYPNLPLGELSPPMTSQCGRTSRPVHPTRIAVCPTSGDLLVVDAKQSLLQVRIFPFYHHVLFLIALDSMISIISSKRFLVSYDLMHTFFSACDQCIVGLKNFILREFVNVRRTFNNKKCVFSFAWTLPPARTIWESEPDECFSVLQDLFLHVNNWESQSSAACIMWHHIHCSKTAWNVQFYSSGGRLESCTEISSVSGGCFLYQSDHRRVAVSCLEPRGLVEVYYRAGPILIHEDRVVTIGQTLNVVTYGQGFIAVQPDRFVLCVILT
jgi:hypothetical protein